MKKTTILSINLLFAIFCIAQNTESITFKVEDFATNKLVAGAQISIKEAGWATKSTGVDGKVLFAKMPMGEIHYTVLKDGFQRLDGAVNVTTKGDDNNFLLSLNKTPKPNEDKILITGEVNDAEGRDVEGALVEAKIANIIRTVKTDESGNYSIEIILNGNPGGTKIFMEIKTKSGCKQKESFDLPREVVIVKDYKMNCGPNAGELPSSTASNKSGCDKENMPYIMENNSIKIGLCQCYYYSNKIICPLWVKNKATTVQSIYISGDKDSRLIIDYGKDFSATNSTLMSVSSGNSCCAYADIPVTKNGVPASVSFDNVQTKSKTIESLEIRSSFGTKSFPDVPLINGPPPQR